jgi:hypothetical protein
MDKLFPTTRRWRRRDGDVAVVGGPTDAGILKRWPNIEPNSRGLAAARQAFVTMTVTQSQGS